MKKKINEADFIGGQGPLTKEEEVALSQYFAGKKNKKDKYRNLAPGKKRQNQNRRLVPDNGTNR